MFETFEFINEDFPWFFASLATIFGAVTGSFLNVCIYRIPVGRSIIFPGSSCACGRSIPFYHNIPIFSWLILQGKTSCCEETFSIRYPAIELLTAILFFWVWTIHSPIVAIIGMLFSAFLICSTFIDLDHMIIPDRFSIGGMIIGVILSFIFPSLHGLRPDFLTSSVRLIWLKVLMIWRLNNWQLRSLRYLAWQIRRKTCFIS